MRVLVVGAGAREHALCWRLAQEPGVEVWAAPGSAGLRAVARCVPVGVDDAGALADLCGREGIGLAVIGPEAPLVAGVADRLRARGTPVLGPSAAAARIEGSKRWAMAFCGRHRIPAPGFEVAADAAAAVVVAGRRPLPVVCKADGLMAGKGVVVAATRAEALRAAKALAGHGPVVFEDFLVGAEVSAFALCDGRHACFYGLARDHKRLLAGERGPMTGGMGAYAPVPDVDARGREQVAAILQAAVDGLAAEGSPFVGFLFAGLMLTADGPRVLEFNCRFGDPEAQALMPLLGGAAAEPWLAAARGALGGDGAVEGVGGDGRWRAGEAAVGVVLAAAGYPEATRVGQVIEGLDAQGGIEEALCFHGATAFAEGAWRTTGGRVLTVVGRGEGLAAARAAAYRAVARVGFEGGQWRSDIAALGAAGWGPNGGQGPTREQSGAVGPEAGPGPGPGPGGRTTWG